MSRKSHIDGLSIEKRFSISALYLDCEMLRGLSITFLTVVSIVTILTTGGPLQMQVQGSTITDDRESSSAPLGSETTEDEKTDENKDSGSALSAVPQDLESADDGEEEGEEPGSDDTDISNFMTGSISPSFIYKKTLLDDPDGEAMGWTPSSTQISFNIEDPDLTGNYFVSAVVSDIKVVCSVNYMKEQQFGIRCDGAVENGSPLNYLVIKW